MTDRLEKISQGIKCPGDVFVDGVDIIWMAGEIENLREQLAHITNIRRVRDEWLEIAIEHKKTIDELRQAAHGDQAVIRRLRQERVAAINEADAYREERDEFRAKLAQAYQYAVSRGGRVPK